jgi:transposase
VTQSGNANSCPNCQLLEQQVADLKRANARLQLRVADLQRRNRVVIARARAFQAKLQQEQALHLAAQDRVKELDERVNTNASNSHIPPSANPFGAPRPTVKKPTGRKRGAQIGHPGHYRKLIPSEQADERIEHKPKVCQRCRASLQGRPATLIGRHQVAELPVRAVRIIEHQSFACRCEQCGTVNRGQIPDAVRVSVTGERLSAAIGLLSSRVQGSRRAVAEAVTELLGSPIALGSISARERELSRALAGGYNQLVNEVADSDVKYVDETGWLLKGKKIWLFTAVTDNAVIFRVERVRTRPSLKALFGGKLHGTFCTDRHSIYDVLPAVRRGLCWAHLKRDFVRCMERGGASEPIGRDGGEISQAVFALWRKYREGRITRQQLQEQIEPLKTRMHDVLLAGVATGVKKTKGLCQHLLKREESMWRFAYVQGLEPTNNLAERMLRPAVVWRKKSFGSDSKRGCRFASRILSVVQTLKMRGQNALDYLAAAVKAYREGASPPPLPSAVRQE